MTTPEHSQGGKLPSAHSDDNNAAPILKAKHTPTPWSHETHIRIENDSAPNFEYMSPSEIARYPESKANSAYILRAVNNFEALVGALGRTIQQLSSIRNNLPENSLGRAETDQVIFHCSNILEQARNAQQP